MIIYQDMFPKPLMHQTARLKRSQPQSCACREKTAMGIPNQKTKNRISSVAANPSYMHSRNNCTERNHREPSTRQQRAPCSHESGIESVMLRNIPIRIAQSLLLPILSASIPNRSRSISRFAAPRVDHARAPIVLASIGVGHRRCGRNDCRGGDEARGRSSALVVDGCGVGRPFAVIVAVYDAAAFEVRAC